MSENEEQKLREIGEYEYELEKSTIRYILAPGLDEISGEDTVGRNKSATRDENSFDTQEAVTADELKADNTAVEEELTAFGDAYEEDFADADLSFDFTDEESSTIETPATRPAKESGQVAPKPATQSEQMLLALETKETEDGNIPLKSVLRNPPTPRVRFPARNIVAEQRQFAKRH